MPGIGNLNETALHEALKYHYAGRDGEVEQKVEGYVIDVIRDGELVEIQTRGFDKLRGKIEHLLPGKAMRIVHPIVQMLHITKLSQTGELISARRSPRRGRWEEVYREIAWIADLLPHKGLTIEIALVNAVEIRIDDGKGSWRRRGVSIAERRLDSIVDTIALRRPRDYRSVLPESLPPEFTNKQLGEALGAGYRIVQPITNALRKMNLIKLSDVRSRQHVYQVR